MGGAGFMGAGVMSQGAQPALKTAGLIIIGDEILSGRTRDKNVQTLAVWLGELSVYVKEVRIIPDDRAVIVDTVRTFADAFDYVFTSGGIGPTDDDITSEAVAAAVGRPHGLHQEAYDILNAYYGEEEFTLARQRMAQMPEGAGLIDNPVSKAPAFFVGPIFVLPGIPIILEAMLPGIAHRISGGPKVHSVTISVPMVEGEFAPLMAEISDMFPVVSIGSYPFLRAGQLGLSAVFRSTDAAAVEAAKTHFFTLLTDLNITPFSETLGSQDGTATVG
ncbi:MAG: competence/damage-inducible protein A [Pseudomonadota bacterium]